MYRTQLSSLEIPNGGELPIVHDLRHHFYTRPESEGSMLAGNGTQLRPFDPDPATRALAAAWAVRDLVQAAEGRLPATWSATVDLGVLPPLVTSYLRHLHCGCAWAEALSEQAG